MVGECGRFFFTSCERRELRPWPVIGRTIFFTSDKNRPTRSQQSRTGMKFISLLFGAKISVCIG